MATVEGGSLFMNNINPLLELLPDGVFRQMMLQQIEKLTGLATDSIKSKLTAQSQSTFKRLPLNRTEVGGMTKVSWLIAMLLKQPDLALNTENTEILKKSKAKGADTLYQLIESIKLTPGVTTAQVLERWRDSKFSRRFHELSTLEILESEGMDLEREFVDALTSISTETDKPFNEAKNTSLQDAPEDLLKRLKDLQK